MSRGGKFGWFLGLIFGALFGVLFAPSKGKDLRNRIKADRKKGKLGIAPLQDDLRYIGEEIAGMAKDFYYSKAVQDIVEKGRGELKGLSGDLVDEVADFHKTRIAPFKRKVSKSAKIGKRAVKDIKMEMRKKK